VGGRSKHCVHTPDRCIEVLDGAERGSKRRQPSFVNHTADTSPPDLAGSTPTWITLGLSALIHNLLRFFEQPHNHVKP